MSTIDGIAASLREALVRTTGSLVVEDRDFGANLRLGEIIRGRVMRHYEGGRYLVQFGQHEKVVDSSIPLRVSEHFSARVKALGDRVELQHLREEASAAASALETDAARGVPRDELAALLARWNVELAPEVAASVARLARRSSDPSLVRLASVVVHKLGAPLAEELIAAVAARLAGERARGTPERDRAPLALAVEAGGEGAVDAAEASLEPIVALLASLADAGERGAAREPDAPDAVDEPDAAPLEADTGSQDDGRREPRDWSWQAGQWLCNVQSHPRIAHRLLRVPLWIGDRLSELEVALFEQAGERAAGDAFRLQRVVLRLDLEQLGRVQVHLTGAGRRLRLRVACDREAGAEALAHHAPALRAELTARGWQVDELEHVLERERTGDAPVEAVVLHHITQDSLSRWM